MRRVLAAATLVGMSLMAAVRPAEAEETPAEDPPACTAAPAPVSPPADGGAPIVDAPAAADGPPAAADEPAGVQAEVAVPDEHPEPAVDEPSGEQACEPEMAKVDQPAVTPDASLSAAATPTNALAAKQVPAAAVAAAVLPKSTPAAAAAAALPQHRSGCHAARTCPSDRGTYTQVGTAAVAAPARAVPRQTRDTKNCSDFQFQEDAQAEFDRDRSDPHNLDGNDNDGKACESLRSRGGGGTTTTTTRPGTSGQQMADTGSNPGPTAAAGAGLILAGTLMARSGRRRKELAAFRYEVFGGS